MIILYHGSNLKISVIDLAITKKGKDFGKGFYLNANRDQAYLMAKRTVRRTGKGEPILNAYQFDDSILKKSNGLNIKIFEDYTEEWAEFILRNRKNDSDVNSHNYDIVIGPIADDTVGVQIYRFLQGYIDIQTLIKELKYRGDRAIQYFFGTENAINLLQKVD
jgi:hypothetical protein